MSRRLVHRFATQRRWPYQLIVYLKTSRLTVTAWGGLGRLLIANGLAAPEFDTVIFKTPWQMIRWASWFRWWGTGLRLRICFILPVIIISIATLSSRTERIRGSMLEAVCVARAVVESLHPSSWGFNTERWSTDMSTVGSKGLYRLLVLAMPTALSRIFIAFTIAHRPSW